MSLWFLLVAWPRFPTFHTSRKRSAFLLVPGQSPMMTANPCDDRPMAAPLRARCLCKPVFILCFSCGGGEAKTLGVLLRPGTGTEPSTPGTEPGQAAATAARCGRGSIGEGPSVLPRVQVGAPLLHLLTRKAVKWCVFRASEERDGASPEMGHSASGSQSGDRRLSPAPPRP